METNFDPQQLVRELRLGNITYEEYRIRTALLEREFRGALDKALGDAYITQLHDASIQPGVPA